MDTKTYPIIITSGPLVYCKIYYHFTCKRFQKLYQLKPNIVIYISLLHMCLYSLELTNIAVTYFNNGMTEFVAFLHIYLISYDVFIRSTNISILLTLFKFTYFQHYVSTHAWIWKSYNKPWLWSFQYRRCAIIDNAHRY